MPVDEVSPRLPANSIAHFTNKYKYDWNTNTVIINQTDQNITPKEIVNTM